MPSKKLTTKFCRLLAEAAEAAKADESQFKIPSEKNEKCGSGEGVGTAQEAKRPASLIKAEDVLSSAALIPEADTFRMMAATLQNMVISKAEEKVRRGKHRHRVKIQNGIDENDAWNPPTFCEHYDQPPLVNSSAKT